MKQVWFLFIVFMLPATILAQVVSPKTVVLDTVRLNKLTDKKNWQTYQIIDLKDSLSETGSIPELLNEKTALFIKEYGKGMLAGISLRGTGTAHTQVVWNGIPVNSILTGQTDLNTFSPAGFDNVYLKKGGSSVSFGSGAIGGVLVFDDQIKFDKAFRLQNQTKLASFQTFGNSFKILNSTGKLFTKAQLTFLKSQNNYPFVNHDITNENGAYQGLDWALVTGYKINSKNKIYFKSKNSIWDRETSRTLYMPQNARLKTANRYFLTGWNYQNSHLSNRLDVAYITEKIRYFQNKNKDQFSLSQGHRFIIKNLSIWQKSKQQKIIFGQEFTNQTAIGDHINRHFRNNFALFAIWSNSFKRLAYQFKIRQDFNQRQKIPLTGAIELMYSLKSRHKIRFNASHNYRLPTFNDLYWVPGGNPNLKPEDSYSYEAGYDFKRKKIQLNLTFFYISSRDLIKWVPVNGNFWQPQNFEKVIYKGVEFSTTQQLNIGKNWQFKNRLNFNYQQAKNVKKQKLLPFTPQWTGQNSFSVFYKKITFNYKFHYQGEIFTTTTNTKFMPAYQLHNVSLDFRINRHFQTRININNLLNTYYENIPSRPLPGRYYELILNFKL